MMPPVPHLSPLDLRLKVVGLMLEPAVRLARVISLPLDDLHELATVAYFREARQHGMSFRMIARRFDKSVRTITYLAQRASVDGRALDLSQRLTWRRKILELIMNEPGVRADDLSGRLVGAPEGVLDAECGELLEDGTLENHDGVLSIAKHHLDMVSSDPEKRIDSLRHFLTTVTAVIYRRFFEPTPEAEAFARVLTFRANHGKVGELRDALYEQIRGQVFSADDADGTDSNAAAASLSFCIAELPTDARWQRSTPPDEAT